MARDGDAAARGRLSLAPPDPPSPEALRAALAAQRDRGPDGRRLGQMRWARVGDSVWLFPAALGRHPAGLPVFRLARCGPLGPAPVSAAFWLATAARQDVWRALRRMPGFVPVIRVAPVTPDRPTGVLAGGVLPAPGAAGAAGADLETLLAPRRVARWRRWARARAPGRSTARRS